MELGLKNATNPLTCDIVKYIYVNTAIDDGSDIAKLMQYFKNSTGIHPLFEKLSSQVYHYKEISEGGNHMASVFDEVLEEALNDGRNESRKEMAIALLKENVFSNSKIAELTKLPLEEVEALQKAI